MISKYKFSISIVTVIVVLIWVWTAATVVTGKENAINARIDMIEHSSKDHSERLSILRSRANACENSTIAVQSDIRLIRQDMGYIRKGIEKLWDRYDDERKKKVRDPR